LGNDHIEAARAFHAVTKHSYTSVRSAPHRLDWDNKPLPYKVYPDAAAIALPRDLHLTAMPALAAIASDAPADGSGRLGLENLTRLLFCAGGLTRSQRIGAEVYHFRAAPSAGALYPIEIYLAAGEVEGIEAGLYHFSPADLKLIGLRRGDWRGLLARAAAMNRKLSNAGAVVLLTSIFWRSAWKYRARAYRYCFWDAGTMLANLLAAASADGISSAIVTAFEDTPVEALLGIDGRREGMVALVALGNGAPPPPEPAALGPLAFESIPLSSGEVEYPDLMKIHTESRLTTREEVETVARAQLAPSALERARAGEVVAPATIDASHSLGLGETILLRGSTRAFARAPITAAELAAIMAASSGHPRADFPPLTDSYLIVNAAEGIEPGAYFYHRASREFELIRRGDFRAEAGYLCLEQPLGMDCAALVVYMADLERVLGALGNRAYRDVHLEAGLHGGRAYLAAYSLERGATGLTFYDDDTTKFFEPHATGKSPLLMVALGVPRSRAAAEN
jgi:SagB-type dehydrogenase family enzyme